MFFHLMMVDNCHKQNIQASTYVYLSVSTSILMYQHQNLPTNKISCSSGTGQEWTSVLGPRVSPNGSHLPTVLPGFQLDTGSTISAYSLVFTHQRSFFLQICLRTNPTLKVRKLNIRKKKKKFSNSEQSAALHCMQDLQRRPQTNTRTESNPSTLACVQVGG